MKLETAWDQRLCRTEFKEFFNKVWSKGLKEIEGEFVPGAHIDRWCGELQSNRLTAKESARKHAKSEILHAFGPWLLYRRKRSAEIFYFSYKMELARYHIARIKRFMQIIPEFKDVQWLSDSDSAISCRWPKTKLRLDIVPAGIKGFKRGPHPDGAIFDDILKDPTQRKLNVEELKTIRNVFFEECFSLPKEGGFIHVWGTSQDPSDLFHEIKDSGKFHSTCEPAIINEAEKKVLWPEKMGYERLCEIRDTIKQMAFNKEYQCAPVRGEEGYFKESEINMCCPVAIKEWEEVQEILIPVKDTQNQVFGGFDIGKKRNPSHLALFELVDGMLEQRVSMWMDNWDYIDQVDKLRELGVSYNVDKLPYDNTRGEFESFKEAGTLPEFMEPISMSGKKNGEIASGFEQRVRNKVQGQTSPTIKFLPDARQKRQILAVDNQLHAPDTAEGHGDSFWSCGLACYAAQGAVQDFPGGSVDPSEGGQDAEEKKEADGLLSQSVDPEEGGDIYGRW